MVMKLHSKKHLLRSMKQGGLLCFAPILLACITVALFVGLQSTAAAISSITHEGTDGLQTISDMLMGSSISMSAVLAVLLVIVCYSSTVHKISEDRQLIGAQMAMGMKFVEIRRYYLSYYLLAALIATLCGWILGLVVVEIPTLAVVRSVVAVSFIPIHFSLASAILSAVVCLAVFMIPTILVCSHTYKSQIALLRGMPLSENQATHQQKQTSNQGVSRVRRKIKNTFGNKRNAVSAILCAMLCVMLLVSCFSLIMGCAHMDADLCAVGRMIAVIYTVLVVLTVFPVLLNQGYIHFRRKEPELALMRINGYTVRQAKTYLFGEKALLSLPGLIFGAVFGIACGSLSLHILGATGNALSFRVCLIAGILYVVLSLVTDMIVMRRVNSIKLTADHGSR